MNGKQTKQDHSPERLRQLFKRYLDGQCGATELDELLRYFDLPVHTTELGELVEEALRNEAFSVEEEPLIDDTIRRNEASILAIPDIRRIGAQRRWWRPVAVAAAIFIVVAGSWLLLENRWTPSSTVEFVDIEPGGNKATLTLADGSTIDLSDDQEGIIIGEDDINYTDGSSVGAIKPSTEMENNPSLAKTLVLQTPVGGQYQITLPDGTKVWLNSSTILKYPNQFVGNERRVELSGEAYFEVASNKQQPFKVSSANQEVTVLGTQFNISAYPDEKELKTTLVEGSVQVSIQAETQVTKLRPNQQSIVTGSSIAVKAINPEAVIAWKNGEFVFGIDDFRTTMRKIARWYDVEIVYDPSAPQDVALGGWVSRNKNLSSVLNVMEKSGKVRFQISPEDSSGKGRRITVMK